MGQRNRRASDYFDVYVVSMTITSHHTILVVKVWSTGRRQARAMVETTCDPKYVCWDHVSGDHTVERQCDGFNSRVVK